MKVLLIIMMLASADKPTPASVYAECVKQELKFPMIVTAQAMIETGWLKHYKGENLFGLYNSEKHEFMDFSKKGWRYSVTKYKELIQDRYYKGGDYLKFLECMWKGSTGKCKRYAQDKDYLWKIGSVMKRLKKLLSCSNG